MTELAPHYYVKPTPGVASEALPPTSAGEVRIRKRWLPDGCARAGCGRRPTDPIHLRPPADDPLEGLLAPTGTSG